MIAALNVVSRHFALENLQITNDSLRGWVGVFLGKGKK
jgi:hypothetical protein